MRGRRAPWVIGGVAALLVVAAASVALLVLGSDDGDAPDDTAADYLAAWEDGNYEAMSRLVDEPSDALAEEHESFATAMHIAEARYELEEVESEDDDALVTFRAELELEGLGPWSYEGRLRLRRTGEDDTWQVHWTPAAIHPGQQEDLRLQMVRSWPERGAITDAQGEPLVTEQPAVLVGIEPRRMDDVDERGEIKAALREHLDVDPALVDEVLDAPGVQPDHLLEVVTVPTARFDRVRDELFPVPGLVFRDRQARQGPDEVFARHVLGRTAEITAEQLEELGPPYMAGDVVGVSGLEARFETELAGTPSGAIQLVDGEGEIAEEVDTIAGQEPADVTTTLDPAVQAAVDDALRGVDTPVGAVVVDADGNVRAVASRPLDDGFNYALAGAYPPGSTFKVVTTDALLASGVTPETEVECRQTIVAGGREFKNFEDASLGSVPFSRAFAESCNTAFISTAADLSNADLSQAAQRFGFNTDYSVGLTTVGGEFPELADATEQAAAAIGQARITASPLHMATVAAAVIDGTWEPPTLLPEERMEQDPRQLDPVARDTLASLMELVVREGSGQPARVDGATIAGKTGTAEFGSGEPLPTHAWFIGFRGNLALGIVLDDGGVGGRDAAPIAGRIFERLPG